MRRSTIQRIFAASALIVAASAALAFGVARLRREPPREVEAVASLPSSSSPASIVQGQNSVRSTAQITTNVASGATNLPSDAKTPVFDVVRIDSTGDAVIAGGATPGAIVELLRDGKVEGRVTADRTGQFVMTPARLPIGEYQLTLRSTQADGKQAHSKQSVAVALQPPEKEQTTVALRTPDNKRGDDANVSYRSLPPLTPVQASVATTAVHRSSHRHIGHHFHVP